MGYLQNIENSLIKLDFNCLRSRLDTSNNLSTPTIDKLPIKDHKKTNINDTLQQGQLMIPETNFSATFVRVGYFELNVIIDYHQVYDFEYFITQEL